MPVYIDRLRNWGWHLGPSCHMIADSNEELHAFAVRLGLRKAWFQKSTSGPHYDLTANRRVEAVRLGAVELDDREFHAILNRWREEAMRLLKSATTDEEMRQIREHLYR